jgi:type II secretory pathway pseudopilin PulG
MSYMKADYGADGRGPLRLQPQPSHGHILEGMIVGAFIGWLVFRGTAGYNIRTPRVQWAWFAALLVLAVVLCYPPFWPASLTLFLGLWVLAFVVLCAGPILMRRDVVRQMTAQYAQLQASHRQQQAYEQQVAENERQAAAQATGQAVVDGLRQAYQETRQEPQETAGTTVHTDAAQQRPQSPTAASQRALPPAPEAKPRSTPASPPPPPGSGTPKLWVPTYSGRAKPVQRRETTLGGVSVADHRSVDPDTL